MQKKKKKTQKNQTAINVEAVSIRKRAFYKCQPHDVDQSGWLRDGEERFGYRIVTQCLKRTPQITC